MPTRSTAKKVGSSPPARGAQPRLRKVPGGRGTIPARAESQVWTAHLAVHVRAPPRTPPRALEAGSSVKYQPRRRGEQSTGPDRSGGGAGHPRMRGVLVHLLPVVWHVVGTILPPRGGRPVSAHQLSVRGPSSRTTEHRLPAGVSVIGAGPSLQARAHEGDDLGAGQVGAIPTGAGSSCPAARPSCGLRDHPRESGDTR